MFETIIVPLDGSDLAEAALAPALELREKFGAQLILLRAVESLAMRLAQMPAVLEPAAGGVASVELLEEAVVAEEKDAHAYLDGLRSKLGDGGQIETVVVEGNPADAIVMIATDRKAGLIVMSSHGRGGLGRLVFGSVADAVLRRSKTPVLLNRSKEPG